ncbi:hypothetical protein IT575_13535 [bacterium]|nr:hypothetical protein [bacterium]
MSSVMAGPKRYVLIDDAQGLGSREDGGSFSRTKQRSLGYATVENLQPGGGAAAIAGLIIPPIPKQSELRPPRPASRPERRARASTALPKIMVLLAALLLVSGSVWLGLAQPWHRPAGAASGEIEPEGDTLSLPQSCLLGKLGLTSELPFVRFDGHYPEQWPAGMTLPFGFFNQGQGKLSVSPARPGDRHYDGLEKIEFKGVVRSSPDALVAFFRKALPEAGLAITNDERSMPKEIAGVGTDPGRIAITARPEGSQSTYPIFYVRIALLDDMGGWAYCTGHWIFGNYQLREGEFMPRVPKDAAIVDEQGLVLDPGGKLEPHEEHAEH